jgi:hypothetical protein
MRIKMAEIKFLQTAAVYTLQDETSSLVKRNKLQIINTGGDDRLEKELT